MKKIRRHGFAELLSFIRVSRFATPIPISTDTHKIASGIKTPAVIVFRRHF